MSERAETAERIVAVTTETFEASVLDAPGDVVVEFMSYGCGHCRTLEPILRRVAAMVPDGERFFRVNVAAEPDLAERYAVRGTPTLVMFSHATEVGRVEGPHPSVASVLGAVTQPFAA